MKTFGILFFLIISQLAQAQTHSISFEVGVYTLTVKKWVSSLDVVSDIDSFTYIKKQLGGEDPLHATGHRDVIYWIPASTDLSKPFTVLLWFHGHNGYDQQRTFTTRTLSQVLPKAREGSNFILVLPEMPWTLHGKTPTKRNSLIWTKQGDFLKFIEEVKLVLRNHHGSEIASQDYRIVGHSAGGSAIKRIATTGDLCKLNPSMIVWSDSSYGRWLDDAWDGCLSTASSFIGLYVRKGDSPYKNLKRFLTKFSNKELPVNLKFVIMDRRLWSHKKIGDNIVDLSGVLEVEEYKCHQ